MLFNEWLAGTIYLLVLLALIPATLLGNPVFLRSGVLIFKAGYTIWHDVVLGEVLFALPPFLYECFRRQGRVYEVMLGDGAA